MPGPKKLFEVAPAEGYDPQVGLLLAALQDSTREWRDELGKVPEDAIVWQAVPGGHSIGGLLLHLGETEAWWVEVVAAGKRLSAAELKELMSKEIQQYKGLWPVPPHMPLNDYYAILDRIRARTLETARAFTDPAKMYERKRWNCEFSLRWILAHVVGHDSYHGGQAVLLKALWEAREGSVEY